MGGSTWIACYSITEQVNRIPHPLFSARDHRLSTNYLNLEFAFNKLPEIHRKIEPKKGSSSANP
jgi:hypothetical protein